MGSRGATALLALAVGLATPAVADAAPKLFHDSFSATYRQPFGAAPTGSNVTLRLRITGAKVKTTELRVTGRKARRMKRKGSMWSAVLRTPAKPTILKYAFRVKTTKGLYWYGDDNSGVDTRKGGTGRQTRIQGDGFQLTVYAGDFTTPSWLRGAFVYEIFPDRFRNGDPSNDYCRTGSSSGCPGWYGGTSQAMLHNTWNEPLEDSRATGQFNRDFFGGDLEGVEENLPYLKSLGVQAIWLTPIFFARSNHRYDTADYMHIDEALGRDPAFTSLVAAAHASGIRLILDGVFNHTSSDSIYFDRYHQWDTVGACESPSSPYRSWYEITGTDVPCTSYTGFANLDSLPQLNHSSPQVQDFVYRGSDSVVRHWLGLGADGWRLDAAQEIDHSWWRDFRAVVKGYAPDAPLIGEVTAGPVDATGYLLGNELDGDMNYRFRNAADGFARITPWSDSSGGIDPLTPSQLDHSLKAMLEDYPLAASQVNFQLVDSHDTNRALFVLTEPGDPLSVAKERQKLAALLQFTYVGAPMVYYGDEIGINAPGRDGFGDPYNRAPYPWTDETGSVGTYGPPDDSMLAYYTKLAQIRRDYPVLKTGGFTTLLTGDTTASAGDNDVYAFLRSATGQQSVVVVMNKGDSQEQVTIPVKGVYSDGQVIEDAITGATFTVHGNAVTMNVHPRSGLVIVG